MKLLKRFWLSIIAVLFAIVCLVILTISASAENKVNTNTVNRTQSEQSKETYYNVYMSVFNYPLKSFYSVYNRVPTHEEYYKLIDSLPWQTPNGKDSIKWVPDKTFPSKGVITVLKRDFSGSRFFTIDFNPNSASTDTSCDGSNATFEEQNNVTQDDHLNYLRFRFIRELIGSGVIQYQWRNNGESPSNISEIEQILGLEPNPNVTYDSLGITFDFSNSPNTITYKNEKLPEKFTKPIQIDTSRFMKNSKDERVPIISWP